MKYKYTIPFLFCTLLMDVACNSEGLSPTSNARDSINQSSDLMKTSIIIKVGDKKFNATLTDNASVTAFKVMLPLTMNMTDLNENEKYFQLAKRLPTNASNAGTINTGDLMLWGSNTLVLFYETFATSYSYTKLGTIDDPTGLAAALGSGNVTVTIELQ